MSDFPPPSEIMRARRPYLYSDSSTSGAYTLSRSEFSHFLDTLTERNQHKEFEIFCRHLCERLICPNLRTQTGPDGGGDGKVDTETYAVASEVSDRWFIGESNSGKERWGLPGWIYINAIPANSAHFWNAKHYKKANMNENAPVSSSNTTVQNKTQMAVASGMSARRGHVKDPRAL